jgi:hypothetical protein
MQVKQGILAAKPQEFRAIKIGRLVEVECCIIPLFRSITRLYWTDGYLDQQQSSFQQC